MSFIEINNIRVEDKVLTTKFICDYEVCKGSCCYKTLPGVPLYGGSLSDYEAAEILLKRKELSELCDDEDKDVASDKPVVKHGEHFYTNLCGDKCVLSSMKLKGCALKFAGKVTDIGIPITCRLYPLSLEVEDSKEVLVVRDTFGELCDCGYKKGEREGIYLIDFLKDAIIYAFGEEFYSKLKEAQKNL